MHTSRILPMAFVCGLLECMAANATPVTYAFSGTVSRDITGGSLQPPIGTPVTGTYTFDLADGVASQSRLPISGTSEWFVIESSGPLVRIPTLNPDYVFSDTVHIVSFSYQTNPVPGPYQSDSYVEGIPGATGTWIVGGPPGGNVYVANEYQVSSADGHNATESFLILDNPNHDPWSGVGLPVFSHGTLGQGLFITIVNGTESGVIYNISSFHRVPENGVPEPGTLSLLALGLAGVGFMKRRAAI